MPFTPGHEPFGVVEALGPRAKGVEVGRKRVVYPGSAAARRAVSPAGPGQLLRLGTRFLGVIRAGAYSTHVIVPDAKYLLDATRHRRYLRRYARLLCAHNLQRGKQAAGGSAQRSVAVLGCGGLGMIGISILKAKGVNA